MFCNKSKQTVQQDFERTIKLFFQEEKEEETSTIADSNETDPSQVTIEGNSEKKRKIEETKSEPISSDSLPNILFSFYYSHVDSDYRIKNDLINDDQAPSNLHFISGFQAQLDYDAQIEQVVCNLKMGYLKDRLFCIK